MEAQEAVEKTFGRVLRRLREKSGRSHLIFSEHLNINRTHYGRIERGEASLRLRMVEALAKGLGLEISELMILLDKERKRIVKGYVVKPKKVPSA